MFFFSPKSNSQSKLFNNQTNNLLKFAYKKNIPILLINRVHLIKSEKEEPKVNIKKKLINSAKITLKIPKAAPE